MGVDFYKCDICGWIGCETVIDLVEIDHYGEQCICPDCREELFIARDPLKEPTDSAVFLDDFAADKVTFYFAPREKHDRCQDYEWKDWQKFSGASAALAHINGEQTNNYVYGYRCKWDNPFDTPTSYDTNHKARLLSDAATEWINHFQKKHDYSPVCGWVTENLTPKKPEWNEKMKRKLDEEIEDLQEKRQKLEKIE